MNVECDCDLEVMDGFRPVDYRRVLAYRLCQGFGPLIMAGLRPVDVCCENM